MAKVKHIMIICGEASGDLNAAYLARALKDISPDIKISGIGGEFMRNAGATIYEDIKELTVMGLFDVLKKLPRFFVLKKMVLEKIRQDKPDAIVLIDFSGFNLRLASEINKSIPTIYYVSPQVWASRVGRIKSIKKYIHKMLVIFKFEEEFYKKYGVEAQFIGHPLLDIVKPGMMKIDFLNTFKLSEHKTTIALLPGSRRQEVEKILPIMVNAAVLISKKIKNIQFVIAKSTQVDWQVYSRKITSPGIDLNMAEGRTYDCINNADFSIVASGTATLETALLEKPFVVVYKTSLLNYLFYRPQVKVPYISIVNILAKRKIVPEFIQFQARAEKIAKTVVKLLQNSLELKRMQSDLAQIKTLLGEKGASLRAAKIIIDFLGV